jgi:glycosyltransferase involved in cell wall biosynthesis
MNPAGSCLLSAMEAVHEKYSLHLFVNRTDLASTKSVRKIVLPLPRGPVFARYVLFTLFSIAAYAVQNRKRPALKISTQGMFPFCDLSYAHFCHKAYLRGHWREIGGGFLRRGARILTHLWAALTESIAFRSATMIVVPSHGLARELTATYPKLVENKIRVIPNPLDTVAFARPVGFSPSPLLTQLNIPTNTFVLSFCALGDFERKGLRIVFEALAHEPDLPVALIVIGGTPSEIHVYERIADRLGVAHRVNFVGLRKDVRPYLWASSAFVFPSAYEAFPLVSQQAAAAALPLIITRLSGVEEFMVDGVSGWTVERNASAVASAIRQAALNREIAEAMGREARSRVEMYSEELFRAQWKALLGCDEEQTAGEQLRK